MENFSNVSQDFIKQLQQERTDYNHASQVRMQAKSLLQLSVGIYTEPERFVYELLQNAVDAFADTKDDTLNILIKAEGDRFIFMHNGKTFDSKDVEGISDVGNGTKSKDNKKIGYKGIGFKSVFMPSVDHVGIISGQFCFEFDKQKAYSLMPTFPPNEGVLEPNDVPWQVIPIDAPHLRGQSVSGFNVITIVYTKDANIIAGLIENLFSDLQFLLFLSSNNVNISFERNGQHVLSVGKEQTNGNSSTISNVALKLNGQQQSNWMLYTKNVPVPPEVKIALENDFNTPDKLKGAEMVEISFAVQINHNNEVVPLKNTSVFTFLPTSYRGLRQPFLINSNFITDAGRQQLHQESEWNKLIFRKIPELYLDFVSIFSRKYNNFTDVLPTIHPDNDTLVGVYRSALQEAFNSIAFVPNRNGNSLLKIGEVLVDRTGISKGVIPIERMLKHLNRRNNTTFTSDNFVENDGIVKYAQSQINLFDSEDLLKLLTDRETTSNISIQDNIKLIRFLYLFFQQSPINSYKDILSNTSILYDTNGILKRINELFFPSDFEKQNEEMSDVAILNKEIYEEIQNESSLITWLESLGLRELSKASFVEYLFAHHDYITVDNALSIGRFLFSVWKQENFLEKASYGEDIKNLCFLAKDGQLRPISNLYLGSIYRPEDDMEPINQQLDLYISDDYPEGCDVEDWSFFLRKCGAIDKIGMVNKDYTSDELGFRFIKKTAESFRDLKHFHSNYKGYKNPIINIHFKISYFTFIDFNNPKYELDKFIFSKVLSMNRNNWDTSDKVYGNIDYWRDRVEKDLKEFAPYEYKSNYNSFLEYIIANEQKFPTTQGSSEKPKEIFINNPAILELGGKYLPILAINTKVHESWRSILPFKQNLTIGDLLDILDGISIDKEDEKEQKKERISKIYREIIERDEQCSATISEWAKSHKILSQSGEFLPAQELTYITVDGFGNGGSKVYCEKIGQRNRDKMLLLLNTFGVQVITQKDITTDFTNPIENDELKTRLLKKIQYLAILQDNEKLNFEEKKNELEEKIRSTHFYKCNSISLTYGKTNDTISKSTFSKGDNFYYTGKISPALMEPLLSPLCSHLNLGSSNDSKLMVILITDDHQSLVDYLVDCGYDTCNMVAPTLPQEDVERESLSDENQEKDNIIEQYRAKYSELLAEEIGQNIVTNDILNTMRSNSQDEINRQSGKVIERDGLSREEQINAHKEAERVVREKLKKDGYDCSNWILDEDSNDSFPQWHSVNQVDNIVSPDGESINLVIKSAKGGYIYLSATDFEFLTSNSNNVLMVWDGKNVHSVTAEDIFNKDSNVNLIFDTEYTPKHYYAALSKVFQYVKRTTFAVKNPSYNAYDTIKSFGMDSKTEGVQELFDDNDL